MEPRNLPGQVEGQNEPVQDSKEFPSNPFAALKKADVILPSVVDAKAEPTITFSEVKKVAKSYSPSECAKILTVVCKAYLDDKESSLCEQSGITLDIFKRLYKDDFSKFQKEILFRNTGQYSSERRDRVELWSEYLRVQELVRILEDGSVESLNRFYAEIEKSYMQLRKDFKDKIAKAKEKLAKGIDFGAVSPDEGINLVGCVNKLLLLCNKSINTLESENMEIERNKNDLSFFKGKSQFETYYNLRYLQIILQQSQKQNDLSLLSALSSFSDHFCICEFDTVFIKEVNSVLSQVKKIIPSERIDSIALKESVVEVRTQRISSVQSSTDSPDSADIDEGSEFYNAIELKNAIADFVEYKQLVDDADTINKEVDFCISKIGELSNNDMQKWYIKQLNDIQSQAKMLIDSTDEGHEEYYRNGILLNCKLIDYSRKLSKHDVFGLNILKHFELLLSELLKNRDYKALNNAYIKISEFLTEMDRYQHNWEHRYQRAVLLCSEIALENFSKVCNAVVKPIPIINDFGTDTHAVCRAALDKLRPEIAKNVDEIVALTQGLYRAADLVRDPLSEKAQTDLAFAAKSVPGKTSWGKIIAGTFLALAGVAAVVTLCVTVPFTLPLIAAYAASALSTVGGGGLAISGREKDSAAQLSKLSFLSKQEKRKVDENRAFQVLGNGKYKP